MAYNEGLAEKIRTALKGKKGVEEKKMFGGIAFMLDGKMCIGVNGDDLIIRCQPEETEDLLKKPGAKVFNLSGKAAMKGWLLVGGTGISKSFDWWLETC